MAIKRLLSSALLRRLKRDERGTTLVEFAIIAPTFMLLLMGSFDLGYSIFLRSTLAGAVSDAARASTLESAPGSVSSIDAVVTSQMQKINSSASLTFERTSYYDFEDVARAETIIDDDGNGECDAGENFEDENGNGTWDADVGEAGIGGPRDIVLYRVTMEYPRIFPLYGLLGQSQTGSMQYESVLKNQPYGDQDAAPDISTEPC
ncbi:MAG: TadE family protein [Pseudomonadota bacterium]